MFAKKSDGSKDPKKQTQEGKLFFDQKKNLELEEYPIHTMKKDLKMILNGEFSSGQIIIPEKKISFSEEKESQSPLRKDSPFSDSLTSKIEITSEKDKKDDSGGGFFSFFTKNKKEKAEDKRSIEIKEIKEVKGDRFVEKGKELDGLNSKLNLQRKALDKIEKREPAYIGDNIYIKNQPKTQSAVSEEKKEEKIFKRPNFFVETKKTETIDKKESEKTITPEKPETKKTFKEEDSSAKEPEKIERIIFLEKPETKKTFEEKDSSVFREEIFNSKKELEELSRQLGEQRNVLEEIKKEGEIYNEKNINLKNELEIKEEELSRKKEDIEKTEAHILELINKQKELSLKISEKKQIGSSDFQGEISDSKKELEELNGQLETQQKILNMIREEELEYTEKNKLLKEELIKKEKELNEKRIEIEKAENRITGIPIKSNTLEKKEEDLKSFASSEKFFKKEPDKEKQLNSFPNVPSRSVSSGPIPSYKAEPKKETFENSENNSEEKSGGFNKVIAFAGVFSIVLIVGISGYYFWMTRSEGDPIPPVIEPPIENFQPPSLSQENANYLMIDFDISQKEEIALVLRDYSSKVLETNQIGVFEFLVTDSYNSPVRFENFVQKTGLNIPQEVLSQLDSNFSLFIYNYGNKVRLGLSIYAKDESLLKSALFENENKLVEGLSFLYQDVDYISIEETIFSESSEEIFPVRYFNILGPESLAVDYSVYNNQLIIGTTKSTIFSILEYQDKSQIGGL